MAKIYELNYYPTEKGDGIYKICRTKSEAIKEFKKLESKHPDRTGDAFIKVWNAHPDELDAEPIGDINL